MINPLVKIIKEQQSKPSYPYQQKINELKRKLSATDYKAIKYAEGLISEEDYAPIKAERESYRVQIRECEAIIAELKANAST
jgi:hypothetical protein